VNFLDRGRKVANRIFKSGLDIGSTTVKLSILDENNSLIFTNYKRHQLDLISAIINLIEDIPSNIKETPITICATGSGAITLSQKVGIDFEQEVIASTKAVKTFLPTTDVVIELGGEDAKLTFFSDSSIDQRMNENCAGGTGAFIDQMASALKTDASGINELAKNYKTIYPIAARCGVFSKTDIMSLLNEGVAKEDIAASILQAVVNQTIGGLVRGSAIKGNVCFLGGPLFFLSELRKRFTETLKLKSENIFFPENAHFFVSLGAALLGKGNEFTFKAVQEKLQISKNKDLNNRNKNLEPLFKDETEYKKFLLRHGKMSAARLKLEESRGDLFLGVDAGSTTTKAVLIDKNKSIVYCHYGPNQGSPLKSTIDILNNIYEKIPFQAHISGSCVTGYGEALIKAALNFDCGEVETIAHYKAAHYFNPQVSFILDIGGQDMKCIYIKNGLVDKIILNEACSSGCGSFIQNFAESLSSTTQDFAKCALFAKNPIDLGSRCTVFMNSKIKQSQKEGFSIGDISAGLDYSVIKNALHKVIKISDSKELGEQIVVQGGTFLNDGVLRATEKFLKTEVTRPDIAGLMGAFGSALIALQNQTSSTSLISKEKLLDFFYETRTTRCKNCENRCFLNILKFNDGKSFISGNRCENAFENNREQSTTFNMYNYKYKRLFDYYKPLDSNKAFRGEIGIPRVLNIYDNYPFWFTLFTNLGFRVVLSDKSSNAVFNDGLNSIASQTVCFPAKMAHGHIENLAKKGLKTIFYPCIPFEIKEFKEANNHYNCPVVACYPEVIRLNMDTLKENKIKFLQPFLPFNNIKRLTRRLCEEFKDFKISRREIIKSVFKARAEFNLFKKDIRKKAEYIINEVKTNSSSAIILAGRPYHLDPSINHGIADFIISQGIAVLTEDSVSHLAGILSSINFVDQWTYHSRLYRAAKIASETENLELVQLNSFGCGLDAISAEQVEEILSKRGKIYTILKIDEGSNLGAVKIRMRSLFASIKERKRLKLSKNISEMEGINTSKTEKGVKDFNTLLCPQMSPIHFSLIESAFHKHGLKLKVLSKVSSKDIEEGLKYVNNDACYPSIIIIGQFINALKSGKYDLDKTALVISQTGGGCRATNYSRILIKALSKAGFGKVPVFLLSTSKIAENKSVGFSLSMVKDLILAILYGDLVMKLSNRMRPYELYSGHVDALSKSWVRRLSVIIKNNPLFNFRKTVKEIVKDFDNIAIKQIKKPRVGVVGEVLVKFHSTANNNLVSSLEKEGAEVVVPNMMDTLIYFVLDDVYRYKYLEGSFRNKIISLLSNGFIEIFRLFIRKELSKSKNFSSFKTTKKLAKKASDIVSVCNQTGEGWLLTAEMLDLIENDTKNIVCVQPFGCLPNHITGRGVMKELKSRYNGINITAIDYDSGASEVNQINRIKLMMSVAHQNLN
jgi:predicted CoA-substrate-specific enzyme activase